MDKKIVIIGLVIVALAVLAAIFIKMEEGGRLDSAGNQVTFTSPDSKDSVSVVFTEDDRAVLTGAGYEGLVLDLAIAASGARYTNDEADVELWSRGEAVTISKGGTQVFSGNVGGQNDAEKLAGTWVWQATTINDTVTEPRRADAFTITFNEAEDRVNGKTDCNGFFGTYSADGNGLTFGPLASTLMYCEGSQEQEFTSALADVKSFFFAGSGALVLELKNGGTILFGRQ